MRKRERVFRRMYHFGNVPQYAQKNKQGMTMRAKFPNVILIIILRILFSPFFLYLLYFASRNFD